MARQAIGFSYTYARQDHVHPSDTSRAPLVSPTFTGTPAAPTATTGTNTTQVATTAFVAAAAYALPVATSSVLGGVRPDGATIGNSSGAISVTYGTAAGTAAQGNDSRITGALAAATATSTYAPLASPVLTGTPVAPTAAPGTASTQIATTAFVAASTSAYTLPAATASTLGGVKPDGTTIGNSTGAISVNYGSTANTAVQGNDARVTGALAAATAAATYAPLASPALTGAPTAPTAAPGTSSTQLATTAFVSAASSGAYVLPAATSTTLGGVEPDGVTIANSGGAISVNFGTAANTAAQGNDSRIVGALAATTAAATYAPLASPALTGVPAAPTAAVNTATTQLATTGFVTGQAATVAPVMDGTQAIGVSLTYARQDHVHASDTSRAPLASPSFTGVPAAPTAAPGTSTTQLATTAFAAAAYTLPAANSSTLGGVKPDGTTIANSSGAISVNYGTTGGTAAQGNDTRITGAFVRRRSPLDLRATRLPDADRHTPSADGRGEHKHHTGCHHSVCGGPGGFGGAGDGRHADDRRQPDLRSPGSRARQRHKPRAAGEPDVHRHGDDAGGTINAASSVPLRPAPALSPRCDEREVGGAGFTALLAPYALVTSAYVAARGDHLDARRGQDRMAHARNTAARSPLTYGTAANTAAQGNDTGHRGARGDDRCHHLCTAGGADVHRHPGRSRPQRPAHRQRNSRRRLSLAPRHTLCRSPTSSMLGWRQAGWRDDRQRSRAPSA